MAECTDIMIYCYPKKALADQGAALYKSQGFTVVAQHASGSVSIASDPSAQPASVPGDTWVLIAYK